VGSLEVGRGSRGWQSWEAQAEYQARALDLLRSALKLTRPAERAAFWQRTIEPDRALDPIRDSGGYRGLRAHYSQAPR
jgi:hypothetical protein